MERQPYRWLVLVLVVAMNAVPAGMAWTFVALVAAALVADFGRGLESWGPLWSAISLGAMFAVVGGSLGDRFGVRRVVGFGGLAMAAALFARSQADSYSVLLMTMGLFGLSLGCVAPNLSKTLGLWFPAEELGLANGIALGGNGAGVALGAILTPYWVSWAGGWRPVTMTIGIIVAVLSGLWLLGIRDRSHSDAPSGALFEGLRRVMGVRDVWILATCYLLFLGGYLGAYGYAPTYLVQERGFSPERAGLLISLLLWAFVTGALLLPTWSDRLGLRRPVFAPAMVLAGTMVFLSSLSSGPALVMSLVCWGLAAGVVPLLFVAPLEMPRVGPALGGAAVGMALTAGFLGGFVMPLIGMALVSRDPLLGFAFWGTCVAAAGLLFLTLRETGPRRQAQSPAL